MHGVRRQPALVTAADAGVDVAMVYYFFGNKEGGFTAAAVTGPEDIGSRLVRKFVERWDAGAEFEPLVALWNTAPLLPQARNMLHGSLVGPLAKRVGSEFGVSDPELRLELVASHLIGLAFARYQLKIEPMASVGINQLVASIGPTVERYLTDPTAVAS